MLPCHEASGKHFAHYDVMYCSAPRPGDQGAEKQQCYHYQWHPVSCLFYRQMGSESRKLGFMHWCRPDAMTRCGSFAPALCCRDLPAREERHWWTGRLPGDTLVVPLPLSLTRLPSEECFIQRVLAKADTWHTVHRQGFICKSHARRRGINASRLARQGERE